MELLYNAHFRKPFAYPQCNPPCQGVFHTIPVAPHVKGGFHAIFTQTPFARDANRTLISDELPATSICSWTVTIRFARTFDFKYMFKHPVLRKSVSNLC